MGSTEGQRKFHWKRSHGKPVGRREMAEKHYRRAMRTCYQHRANPRIENCLGIPPARPRGNVGDVYRGWHSLGKKFERGVAAEIEEGLQSHFDE
ncbi:hypothetical protein SLS62_006003 [Diatrype stigma]|uniref:Uncharacterized protein n=1 Tax=Diatrype stigma TaxID=117547 RepID=A0AAN9UZD7_9PEZI